MSEKALLFAEPNNLSLELFLKSEPEEIDIYLGELATGALHCLDDLLIKKEIRILEALDLKRKCQRLVALTKRYFPI